jgi:hypothetical protein
MGRPFPEGNAKLSCWPTAWLPNFGGPTSLTQQHIKEGFSFVALRVRLSSGFALHKGIGFCTSKRKEAGKARKNTLFRSTQ